VVAYTQKFPGIALFRPYLSLIWSIFSSFLAFARPFYAKIAKNYITQSVTD